jgi:succinyl-CoA synthetase beta subunit
MDIYEYQSKDLLKKAGVTVPNGVLITDTKNLSKAIAKLRASQYVVKAQIHAGGRAKAGGVKFAKTAAEVENIAKKMIGSKLITHQTGPEGEIVKKVYIESMVTAKQEYHLSLTIDRFKGELVFIAARDAGVDIESMAITHPDKITKVYIEDQLRPFHIKRIADALGVANTLFQSFSDFVTKIYKMFIGFNANQIELNPFTLNKNDEWCALDAKMSFDDHALYSHKILVDLLHSQDGDVFSATAKKNGFSYIGMDGAIGCMVNGAGLAMATMDLIKAAGEEPANFLDISGNANKERVLEALKMILTDKNVSVVLINIFGGIIQCDMIAEAIIAAVKEITIRVPLVVRLAGTNFALGKRLLEEASDLDIITATDLNDAVAKSIEVIRRK